MVMFRLTSKGSNYKDYIFDLQLNQYPKTGISTAYQGRNQDNPGKDPQRSTNYRG